MWTGEERSSCAISYLGWRHMEGGYVVLYTGVTAEWAHCFKELSADLFKTDQH